METSEGTRGRALRLWRGSPAPAGGIASRALAHVPGSSFIQAIDDQPNLPSPNVVQSPRNPRPASAPPDKTKIEDTDSNSGRTRARSVWLSPEQKSASGACLPMARTRRGSYHTRTRVGFAVSLLRGSCRCESESETGKEGGLASICRVSVRGDGHEPTLGGRERTH